MGIIQLNGYAQEKFSKTLNLGLGGGGYSGYYGYVGHILPVIHIDYELSVARNFTLAPFINFYTYSRKYYYNPGYYTYRETVVPIGVKGTYYFDELLNANSQWDFYAAGSLGFAVVSSHWDARYTGDKNFYPRGSALFLDIHIGAEYHFMENLGVFLDLSSGVSTIGIAIH
jgi:hypothetical protein